MDVINNMTRCNFTLPPGGVLLADGTGINCTGFYGYIPPAVDVDGVSKYRPSNCSKCNPM